jgi:hypothetical protein
VAPIAISVMALALCMLAYAGIARDPPGDEGTMAHLYQLSIVMQVPIICMFAGAAVRRGLRQDRPVLGAQLALFVAALAAVPILGL